MSDIMVHANYKQRASMKLNGEDKVDPSILAATHLAFQIRVPDQAVACSSTLVLIAGPGLMAPRVCSNERIQYKYTFWQLYYLCSSILLRSMSPV